LELRVELLILLLSGFAFAESAVQHPIAGAREDIGNRGAWITTFEIVLLISLSIATRNSIQAIHPSIGGVGVFLIILGILLRCLAILSLGEHFKTDAEPFADFKLVTTGIYAHLRHPSETGLILIWFGAACLMQSALGLLFCTGILMPTILLRVYFEERVLRTHLGDDYIRYSQSVPALVPVIRSSRSI